MKVLFRIAFLIILIIAVLVGGVVLWFYSGLGLPRLSSLKEYKAAQNSKVFASDGTLITVLKGDQDREITDLEKIPTALRQAVIAIEDADFYHHKGINWKAVVRALWANVVKGTVVQGGSTITQQYVKNAYVGAERTLVRKIQEAHLAWELEQKYSKDKILELYLNDIYFGRGCYGIWTAARKYFGKLPQDLTLAECATLAAVIRSPSYHDPYIRPQEVIERRNYVLRRMQIQGFINAVQRDIAAKEPMNLAPPNVVYEVRRAPYFCDYITERLRQQYKDQTVYRGGLRVYTTIDLALQDLAEKTVSEMTSDAGPDAALVCIDPRTGYIKAMVGGRNYQVSQFNVAASGHRQAGSAFKVFVLTRALADGISPNQTYDSTSPKELLMPDGTKWTVRNYAGRGSGSMTIREATIRSVNVVFAQLIMDVGPARVAEMAKQMGIRSEVEPNPAIALGGLYHGVTPLDMASAYGTLANGGIHAVPRSYYKVTDPNGNVIDEFKPETNQVVDPSVVEKVNDILQGVVSSGTGTAANIGRPQAGKTGTTEDNADAWFVGYTPDLVTAVWVGHPEGRIPMGGMVGGDLPAEIWRVFMKAALKNVPPTPFPKEGARSRNEEEERESTVTVTLCDESGMLATQYCPHTHSETFREGRQPTSYCPIHKAVANKVPNVVGMTKSAASSTLQGAGYQVASVNQQSSQPAGIVVGQTPAAGSTLAAGATVTIYVSTGVVQSTVPDVVGLPEASAKTKIATAGFVTAVSYSPGPQPGIVISQSPSGGTQAPVGSTVAIVVSRSGGGVPGLGMRTGFPGLLRW